ncbi:MAG: type II secretion system F family protein [Alphaproteobacteria bacterium]|uniref:Type II secretion system F family protein n=1 Tax=Candidatus Nitrobium versatile TaxID=2884831 RepID=A0A953M1H4_9BACT|nr:type II secretion system F family protein [Candidatus Nitrobium versatile]
MSYFAYKAVDPEGVQIRGVEEGEDVDAVYESLAARGLYILSVKRASRILVDLGRSLKARRVKRPDIIEFANNLAVMLKAGLPLLTALGDIADTTGNKYLKSALFGTKRMVEMGMSFSEAVYLHREIFPDIFTRLVKVGEETGQLGRSLSDVAEHLQKMEDLAQAIKRALMYPVFAIVTTMGAMLFWLAYVLPKIMNTMKEMGVKLPLITRMLLKVSAFTQSYWYLIPLFPVAALVIVKLVQRNQGACYYIDMIKIKMPIVKLVVYNKLLALFSEQLRILIVAGLTIDRCLEIVGDVIGNEVFKRAIAGVHVSISAGNRIGESLKEHPVFPPLLVRMVDTGEASGNLDEQFAFLSGHYLKKLDDISEKMGKMVEPIVMAVVGALFALIMIGLMLPLYDLISTVGRAQ